MKLARALVLILATSVGAEPAFTLMDNGDPANRIDVIILGDGFTVGEQGAFREHAEGLAAGMLADPPFSNYRTFFNVHAIEVVSNESGADHPESDLEKDTALGATYSCAGIQRLICVDTAAVEAVLDRSVGPAARDIVLVLVNDLEFGGSGGAYAVASLAEETERITEVMLHEVGHSFAGLADEYTVEDDDPEREIYAGCETEPSQANVTTETARGRIKWNPGGGPPSGWIEQQTGIPTAVEASSTGEEGSEVGLYEGARFCLEGVYRPTPRSKMRSLFRPWDAVNEAEIVKVIYGSVAPIDYVTLMWEDGPPAVVATITRPIPDTMEVIWTLDGTAIGRNDQLDLAQTKPGEYTLELTVADRTSKVRHDPADLLRDARTLTLSIADEDSDGLPDWWERAHELDVGNPDDATEDTDGDGLTNLREFEVGTQPREPDTDEDGASDGEELAEGYDPRDADACPPWACGPSLTRKLLWILSEDRRQPAQL